MTGPLDGVRILDLTSNFMGPYASLLLADMGADVAKVESPEGDTTRGVGPHRHPGMAAIFLHLNRNKRSLVLDLKHPGGRAALLRLLRSADVLLHSLRPAAMQRLGLSYAEVREINPRLVYCGCFGFGQNGPYAAKPAYDDLIQAAVGMPVLQSRGQGEPAYVATAIADRVVGMAASSAVAMALYHRERTGRGQEVQVPMFETFAHFVLGDHLYGHTFVPPIGNWGYARMMNADRRPYRTLDGYLGVNIYTDRHWQRFFTAVGRADLAADPRFAGIHGRTEHIGELYAFLAEVFATRSTGEWLELLTEADIPAIRMHTPETVLTDPHLTEAGFFTEEDHPSEGRLRTIGIPQQWSESTPELRYPAPRLGEHTEDLLRESGFGDDEIGELVASGAARIGVRHDA
ncbi:CaiB/BaiF CoA transferase family protein [Amycolatopsis australiensis]|uniref:Crotonobetainyl-CoA:carnitine CoA-transferase CaiB n=1 Tax=Amycolatopsis australiensis TaxID=546364 RepID=A0A1K1SWD9_9PSEU|nr:CoA transferase [Amycolatopsis australiensis]SFW88657.1 Crotonobetainyl-CoA:carnitine CoA-transferase CaiB [Amycolatopsis australiensis]